MPTRIHTRAHSPAPLASLQTPCSFPSAIEIPFAAPSAGISAGNSDTPGALSQHSENTHVIHIHKHTHAHTHTCMQEKEKKRHAHVHQVVMPEQMNVHARTYPQDNSTFTNITQATKMNSIVSRKKRTGKGFARAQYSDFCYSCIPTSSTFISHLLHIKS